jgi:hypothetical protein
VSQSNQSKAPLPAIDRRFDWFDTLTTRRLVYFDKRLVSLSNHSNRRLVSQSNQSNHSDRRSLVSILGRSLPK